MHCLFYDVLKAKAVQFKERCESSPESSHFRDSKDHSFESRNRDFLNDYIIMYCLCRQVKNAAMLSDLSLWNSLPWLHLATYLFLLQFVLVVNILQLVILMVLQLHILSVTLNIRMYLEWFHFSFSSEFSLMVLGSFGTLTLAMKYLITQSVCSLSSLGNLALIIQCH